MATLNERVPSGPVRGMMVGVPLSLALWAAIGEIALLIAGRPG